MRRWEGLRVFRQRIRATRAGRLSLRIAVGVVGSVVVVVGLLLIPLPGPGWLIVLAGLAILSLEFEWAQRLLTFTRLQLERWWHWLGRQHWTVRALAGLVGLAFAATVVWLSFRYGRSLLRD
jgi:uncharacterized protein (TIGR02611 family)